jgi:two-component system phosphate regulon sensor histidine kinase PhoR
MSLGFRGRLVAASVVLIVVAGLASLLYLEGSLRGVLVSGVRDELRRHAEGYRATLQTLDVDDALLAQRLARAQGGSPQVRLTLIDAQGRVIADSELDSERVRRLESHAQRPEVRAALAGQEGSAQRYSTTVQTNMLYVALPVGGARGGRVVRAATPLARVDALIGGLRGALVVAGVIGLLAALFMSGLASHMFSRSLRDVMERARALLERSGAGVVQGGDELTSIAGSVTRVARELDRSFESLARERDRFSAVLEAMSDGVLAIDGERRITLANPAALEILSMEEDPTGRALAEVARVPALVELTTNAASGHGVEVELAGDVPRTVHAKIARLEQSDGLVLALSDVTQVRRLEAVRRDFVANVSHELRTPVSVIQANAEALVDGALEDPERAHRFADALHRNAERLSHLIDGLLDLSRVESGAWEPDLARVVVLDVVGRVVSGLEGKAEERGHEIDVSVDADLAVVADAGALEQVLVNLVDNALKYTPDGGHITVRAHAQGGHVVIDVADDGPGIAEKHRSRVFQRFYRVDKGRSKATGGTGLGLAIVRHLVLSMGGDIEALANQPQGALFRVTLVESPAAAPA